ncbi:hypothetical protein M8J76_016532 [Diaphorina citri]|nr:hypothetical protein M8J76_016532 [Diaphorina citri]
MVHPPDNTQTPNQHVCWININIGHVAIAITLSGILNEKNNNNNYTTNNNNGEDEHEERHNNRAGHN